ncbi:MAG: hypothetical protein RL376_447 [Verrucomicrobiota bacterium]|jgi:hypothetical protein
MNTLLLLLSVIVVIGLVMSLIASRPRGAQLSALGNVADGYQPAKKTYYADAAISTRNLLVKFGSDASHVALAGVNDIPLGLATDEAAAAEDGIAVSLLGIQECGALAVASAAITEGDLLVPAANGKVRTLPGTTGSYYIIGRALNAAGVDGDVIEFVPTFPVLRVVA